MIRDSELGTCRTVTELEIAELIVSIGSLEIAPQDMNPDEPIFGDSSVLDSIDALELAFRIEQQYGVAIRTDREDVREIFASVRSLTAYINKDRQS